MRKLNKEKIFRFISIIFISVCIIFYGYRFIKYYKVFNPKLSSENEGLLSISVPKNSQIAIEGNGLYRLGGSYVYRGNVDNNYIKFSGMMFRISKITYGGVTELITDETINYLSYDKTNTTFDKSNISAYLNDEFLNKLNKNYLVETESCMDKIVDLTNITCNEKKNMYVKLLDVNSFLNSINETSYISDKELLWLSNINEKEVWHINGSNISSSTADSFYGVKPVITLKYDTVLLSGKGTKDDPYIIEENKDVNYGEYVKLGEDIWQIYNIKDNNLSLVLNDTLDKMYSFSYTKNEYDINDTNSLAYYLNNTYLNSLTYKDLLLDNDWCTGKYDSDYKTVCKTTTKTKIGLNSINDIKYSNDLSQYYLLNGKDEKEVYTFSDELSTSKYNLSKSIRPTIVVNKNIKSGKGTIDDPYIIEVK